MRLSKCGKRAVAAALLWLAAVAMAEARQAAASPSYAVILLYHHVSADTPRSTSVTPEVFERHLDYLADNAFNVWPLEKVALYLNEGREMPPKTVALTFDDGYSSVHDVALPLLQKFGWPFTIFVATDFIREAPGQYMSWEQLRNVIRGGGTIANHSATHEHLVRRHTDETEAEWRSRVIADVKDAAARLRAELAVSSKLFAYPYGEFDPSLESLIASQGYLAFGQQSGPAGSKSSMTALPRFPVATGFDDLEALGEKLRSLPLPILSASPATQVLYSDAGPPVLRLQIAAGPFNPDELRCYVSNQEPAVIHWEQGTAVITARARLAAGRSKFTCTAPSSEHSDVFYWYSHLWMQKNRDGSWYSG